MRLFIAFDIPSDVRARLSQYLERARPLAPDARWARIESLHVTLKFAGEVSEAKIAEIETALSSIKSPAFEVEFKHTGFFPNPRSARVFWAGVNAPEALPQLASAIEFALEKVGIAREKRAYHAHLTLARAGEGKESKYCFRLLQERLSGEDPPLFGTMTAREFFYTKARSCAVALAIPSSSALDFRHSRHMKQWRGLSKTRVGVAERGIPQGPSASAHFTR